MLNSIRLFTEGFMAALVICLTWYILAGHGEHGYTANSISAMAMKLEEVDRE